MINRFIVTILLLVIGQTIRAQEESRVPKFYLGLSYGTSFSIGDFEDTDITNSDAGFAKNGQRFDLYGGYFLNGSGRTTLTGVFRYQTFETEIDDLIEARRSENPGIELIGSTEEWIVYSFLVGLAYRIDIGSKFALFPRAGVGPLFATNPGITVNAPNATITNNFERSSETGGGFGYELGVGLRTNLGRRFVLLPTFTFSGGIVTIKDVSTTTDNIIVISDYQPTILSFNIGLSIGYRFY